MHVGLCGELGWKARASGVSERMGLPQLEGSGMELLKLSSKRCVSRLSGRQGGGRARLLGPAALWAGRPAAQNWLV